MWGKLFKAIKYIIQYAPAVVEVVKEARKRHPDDHKEPAK